MSILPKLEDKKNKYGVRESCTSYYTHTHSAATKPETFFRNWLLVWQPNVFFIACNDGAKYWWRRLSNKHIVHRTLTDRFVKIFTNSQATLLALHNTLITSQLVKNTILSLNTLSRSLRNQGPCRSSGQRTCWWTGPFLCQLPHLLLRNITLPLLC